MDLMYRLKLYLSERNAQSSLEYALVFWGFLALVMAFGSLFHLGEKQILSGLIHNAISHSLHSSDPIHQLIDILLY